MTDPIQSRALVAGTPPLPSAEMAKALTADLSDDMPEIRSYRRLLEQALSAAADARRDLTNARRRIAVLEHQARTDEATGLLNRRGFEFEIASAIARTRRHGENGLLVMIDLDGFKTVNDTYGHQAGDLVLATFGAVLMRYTRESDSVARIGGDEFALILTDANLDGAKRRVKVLDRMLNWTSVPWQGREIPIHASFGWAAYGPEDEPEHLFAEADQAMYARKNGRGKRRAAQKLTEQS